MNKDIPKILMKWSLENRQYDMSLFLYRELGIGIPNKYLYQLSQKKQFISVESFINTHNNISSQGDKYLDGLLKFFPKSKYKRLENWENQYGYCLIK